VGVLRGNVENRLGGFSPFSGLLQGLKAVAMPKELRLLLRAGSVSLGRPGSEVLINQAFVLPRPPLLSYESNSGLRLPWKSIVTGIGKMLPHRITDTFKTVPKKRSSSPAEVSGLVLDSSRHSSRVGSFFASPVRNVATLNRVMLLPRFRGRVILLPKIAWWLRECLHHQAQRHRPNDRCPIPQIQFLSK
jgi:hypothetical protein